jgi:hypothetical protein
MIAMIWLQWFDCNDFIQWFDCNDCNDFYCNDLIAMISFNDFIQWFDCNDCNDFFAKKGNIFGGDLRAN